MNKCYSRDDEFFRFDSLGELIDDMRADGTEPQVGDTYHEANFRRCTADDAISVYWVLEDMDSRMGDDIGESYDDNPFSTTSTEAKDELKQLLEAWVNKHVDLSRYWLIQGRSRECKFVAEDLS